MGRYLVIGGGVTGLSAALDLAASGNDVDVVERRSLVGGEVLGYCCKATDSCARCGVCVAHERLRDASRHERLRLWRASRLLSSSLEEGRVTVQIARALPAVEQRLCTDCDRCRAACPVGCITRYARGGLVQYGIEHSACLLHNGKRCTACLDACPAGAITAGESERRETLSARACLVATGHTPFSPEAKPRYGYRRVAGVITGREAEEILSRRPTLGDGVRSVAFVQCVGSRDPVLGRPWCSAACCAYALRLARVIRHRGPEVAVTIYYIDIQSFDKCFGAFRDELASLGVEMIRGVPFRMDRGEAGAVRVAIEGSGNGAPTSREHDRVVLSVGMGPSWEADETARLLGLARDENGFFRSARETVLVAGTCATPQTIPECIGEASAMAGRMLALAPRPRAVATPVTAEAAAPAPGAKSREIRLDPAVLVLGDGEPARAAVARLRTLGHPVASLGAEERLLGLEGHVGEYRARVGVRARSREVGCGAVLVAGPAEPPTVPLSRYPSRLTVPLASLEDMVSALPREPRVRSVGIVLDLETEEPKAGTASALDLARRLQRTGVVQVLLFAHDARVASPGLQETYDAVRDCGVVAVKYDGPLSISPIPEARVAIRCRDAGLGAEAMYACDAVGVSSLGLIPTPEELRARRELTAALGVGADSQGRIQENNIRLLPVLTSRAGVFVVGSSHGQHYLPDALLETEAAVAAIHALLAPGVLVVELSHAVVDEEKCALCLTCVRACPHHAMGINAEKKAAEADSASCRRCGICAGECPAKAITLPAYEDEAVLGKLGGVAGRRAGAATHA